MRSAPFSPIIIVGPFVLPLMSTGMIEESITLKPFTPHTRNSGSTTDMSSMPSCGPCRVRLRVVIVHDDEGLAPSQCLGNPENPSVALDGRDGAHV